MKVSVICSKIPSLESGSEVRNYYLLKGLVDSKKYSEIKVLVLTFNKPTNSPLITEKLGVSLTVKQLPPRSVILSLRALLSGHIPYVEHLLNNPYTNLINSHVQNTDLVILEDLDSYLLARESLLTLKPKVPVILDCHNVDYLRLASEFKGGNLLQRILGSYLTQKLKKIEMEAVRFASLITVCSKQDKEIFLQNDSQLQIEIIPNGVQIDAFPLVTLQDKESLLFMGTLSYGPNEDGIRYYLEKIHPLVKRFKPNVNFSIIGKNPSMWLKKYANEHTDIHLKGFVPEVQPYIEKATICLCPLRYGSGTRLKLLEYMAAGKPIVSTTIGAEGIDIENGRHAVLADTPEDFASAIVDLLNDAKKAAFLGHQARRLAESYYNWPDIGKRFSRITEKIIK